MPLCTRLTDMSKKAKNKRESCHAEPRQNSKPSHSKADSRADDLAKRPSGPGLGLHETEGYNDLRLRLGGEREKDRQTDRQTDRQRDRDREGQHSKAPKAGGLSSSHASKAATIPASSLISKGLLQS